MKASDIKKGNVVEYNNGVYQIRDIERSSPQGRGGNVRFRFIMYSVPGGNKLDASFDADDNLPEVELLRRQSTFSYMDGDAFFAYVKAQNDIIKAALIKAGSIKSQ